MAKKISMALCGLFLFVLVASGCETAKGAAYGIGTTVDSTAKGAVKDTKGLVKAVLTLDDWIKRNLW